MDYIEWVIRHFGVPDAAAAVLKNKAIDDETLATLVKLISRRAVIKQRNQLGHRWALVEFKNRPSMWLDLGEGTSNWIMKGTYEAEITNFILSTLKPGGTFVDIGANVGWYTLNAAKYYKEHGGKVVCFEPQPEVGRRLAGSVVANDFNDTIAVHHVALSNAPGTVEMIGMESNIGWAQFKPTVGAGAGATDVGFDRFSVTACRLDDMDIQFGDVDILKIDVEGAEVLCFQGAKNFLEKHRPLIVSEIHNKKLVGVSGCTGPEYVSFMAERGYRCEAFTNGGFVPYDPEAFASKTYFNAVFLPE